MMIARRRKPGGCAGKTSLVGWIVAFVCMAVSSPLVAQTPYPQMMSQGEGQYGQASVDSVGVGLPNEQFAADPYLASETRPGNELNSLNYSQSFGDANVNVFAGPNAGMFSVGMGASVGAGANGKGVWSDLRDLQMSVYADENRMTAAGGGSGGIVFDDSWGISGRALIGGTMVDGGRDQFHFTGDVYAATRTSFVSEHWLKAGMLYDYEDDFYRIGPVVGALLWADGQHPVSFDFAYGMGNGDPINVDPFRLLAVADNDYQVRVGTFVTPALQVGVSGQWANWDDSRFEDQDGLGGFMTLNYNFLQFTLDVADDGAGSVRGFANLAITTDAFVAKRYRDKDTGIVNVVHPRDWLTRPVIRDVSLRTQVAQIRQRPAGSGTASPGPAPPVAGSPSGFPISVQCAVVPSSTFGFLGGGDPNNNGIVDEDEQVGIEVILTNTTGQALQNVNVRNFVVSGPATVAANGNPGNVNVGIVQAGEARRLVQSNGEAFRVDINPSVTSTAQIFIEFDVDVAGNVQRFRCGPLRPATSTGTPTPNPTTYGSIDNATEI